LNPHDSAPSGTLIGSDVFAHLARVPNTQTHRQRNRHTDTQTTLGATSVATGRISAQRAGDAA